MMKLERAITGATAFGIAALIATVHAQVGRGGSEWLTAGADAQRTSWIRTDPKISVESMSKPGFELQWSRQLDNQTRELNGLGQGVSANGVTLFIPMTIITGSSNNVYALDNDTGHVVWQRHFDAPLPAGTPQCPGGITAGATRIVPLVPPAITVPAAGGGRAAQAYRSVIGQPGEGAPVAVRGGGPGRGPVAPGAAAAPGAAGATTPPAAATPPVAAPPAAAPAAAAPTAAAPTAAARGAGAGGNAPATATIPGASPESMGGGRGGLGRPSGVVYVVSSDGVLHVMGLPSGKDIQRPAEFIPANARWSDTIAVNTTLYATSTGSCGGAPNAVWGIDLDSDGKPVTSWKTNGGPIVGRVAFGSNGTLFAAVGPGTMNGEGKANAIVALDAKTLALKDWFTSSSAQFLTGPSVFRQNGKDIVAAATKDGRILLLDASSLGGTDHGTPLASASLGQNGSVSPVSTDALTTWQEMTITPPPAPAPVTAGAAPAGPPAAPEPPTIVLGTRWILAGTANGVVAFKLVDSAGSLSLDRGWMSANLAAPSTPIVVNGVVFALSTGMPATAAGRGTPAVLHAYEGATGKELWTSGTSMTAFASPGSFWSAMGQIYVGTNDGKLYAFGFLDERR